jgi:glycosyltransferase involved in cell wall biosynthesis
LRAFDVFALASLYEGLPRVFPQAMAARLPIVATRVDGALETIEPGVNGWLVAAGDTEAMAARLLELAADPARCREMGERGFARVEEFSARRMVSQLEQLYHRLAVAGGRQAVGPGITVRSAGT